MPKFEVRVSRVVTDSLADTIEIEADSLDDAKRKAFESLASGEIDLNLEFEDQVEAEDYIIDAITDEAGEEHEIFEYADGSKYGDFEHGRCRPLSSVEVPVDMLKALHDAFPAEGLRSRSQAEAMAEMVGYIPEGR